MCSVVWNPLHQVKGFDLISELKRKLKLLAGLKKSFFSKTWINETTIKTWFLISAISEALISWDIRLILKNMSIWAKSYFLPIFMYFLHLCIGLYFIWNFTFISWCVYFSLYISIECMNRYQLFIGNHIRIINLKQSTNYKV